MAKKPKRDNVSRMSLCRKCRNETIHNVRGKAEWTDCVEGFKSGETSYLLECAGCQTTSLLKIYRDDSFEHFDDSQESTFPPRSDRSTPPWSVELDLDFRSILDEIYSSLESGGAILPVLGARTILDLVIRKLVGDQGPFENGLNAMVDKGLLSKHDKDNLKVAIDAGNATAHRGFRATSTEIDTVLNITEHLLISHFIFKKAAKALRKRTPRRKRPSGKRPSSTAKGTT